MKRLATGVLLLMISFASADEFFTTKIEPLLKARCFECHSHEKKIKGGLALDSKSGWEKGGESGPALVPGKPEESLLIKAVSWSDSDLQMPPKKKLTAEENAFLSEWIKRGAVDPRVAGKAGRMADSDWEAIFQKRMQWWSLQPVAKVQPPEVKDAAWCRNEIDRFILAGLEAKGLRPAPPADAATLERRLAFTLTGLPPDGSHGSHESHESHATHDRLLASPHFGERFARHWMDVMHYSDTHGYEWDIPAKNVWHYRDYLIRAFNEDVPFDQLIREHLAGDLLPRPRVDAKSGVNESLIGPAVIRLGERKHGDSVGGAGVTEEGVDNAIDTVSKGFLATTVACAHCQAGAVSDEDTLLLNQLLDAKLLPNDLNATPRLEALVTRYCEAELRIVPDRTVGSMADFVEGRNHRIGIRGSWEDQGEEVPRGNIRFLDPDMHGAGTKASGRLELAAADNPLNRRVSKCRSKVARDVDARLPPSAG